MNISKRTSSAALALGAGAAVCLTGGETSAAFVSGTIKTTNGNVSAFGSWDYMYAFNKKVKWQFSVGLSKLVFYGGGHLNKVGGYAVAHNAGVVVSSGLGGGFDDYARVRGDLADKYFAVLFSSGGIRFGWLHVVSTNSSGTSIQIDKWGYDDAGGSVKTLADSLTTRTLTLSDGRVQLHWANTNEDGIARYEVQTQEISGAWKTVASNVPGTGHYTVKLGKGAPCRLSVERIDGTVYTQNF